jgi:hypothetical protein
MKNIHTQQTWKAVAQMPEGYSIENEKGQVIAFTQCDEEYNEDNPITKNEEVANAILIATAPLMLQTLKTIVNEIETTPDVLSEALLGMIKIIAQQTINKAVNDK